MKHTCMNEDTYRKNNSLAIRPAEHAQKNEDELRLLVENIIDYAIFMTDAGGNITGLSKGAERMKGYSEEVLGKHISILYTNDEIALGEPANILKKSEENGHFESEGWRIRKDGTRFWAEVIFTALYEQRKLKGFAIAVRDLTEWKKLEEINLTHEKIEKQNQEKLDKSLRQISDYKYALDESCIVAITDRKGIIKYVNENFCKISKYKAEELIEQDHRIINSGYRPKEFIRNLWVTVANGKIWRGELRNKAKDGSIYWVDTTIVPFLNEHDKPYQYVAIRADITERKITEENLKNTLKEISDYKYALDESSIVAITDQKGIIKYANNNFCKISKYSAEELIGQDLASSNPAIIRKNLFAIYRSLLPMERYGEEN